jgi:nucleoid DNA-binding protein
MIRNKEQLIQKLAEKYALPHKEVEKIVSSQSKLVRKTMAAGKFEAIRLPFLGRFWAKPARIKNIQDAKRKTSRH